MHLSSIKTEVKSLQPTLGTRTLHCPPFWSLVVQYYSSVWRLVLILTARALILEVSLKSLAGTVPYCTALYCTALHCTALHCTALHCTALHCTALHCTVMYCTVLYCASLCCAVLCCAVLYCTVLYCTRLQKLVEK